MTSGCEPGQPWVGGVEDLVAGVRDGDVVGIGGFHFTRAPVAQLLALGRRGVRRLEYVAWGGGLSLELLLAAGAVRRARLTFSSLDLFGLAPRFRRAVERGELELEEWTALGLIAALEAGARNLGYGILQAPEGSDLEAGFATRVADPLPHDAAPVAAVPALHLDWLLLHAQRADDAGNVELSGPRGLDLSAIFAARRVLVTVEERVPAGSLGGRGAFVVPRTFVSGVALAPGGAYPSSCLPFYVADYERLQRVAEAGLEEPLDEALLDPAGADDVRTIASVPAPELRRRLAAIEPDVEASEPFTVDELMAIWIARQLDDRSVCSIGSAAPLATVGYLLAKRLWARGLVLLSSNGGLVDVGLRPLSLLAAEALDVDSAVTHAGGDETYHWYYRRGLVTHEIVGAAQIDARGATNNVRVRRSDGSEVRLPGQGGMADVANLHANFLLYVPRHGPRTFVERVDVVSARRAQRDPELRRRYGLRPGRVAVLTNICVLEQREGGETLVLTHVHPGVTVAEVQRQTGFELTVADDLATTPEPTAEELRVLRDEIDPLGVRRLDFEPAATRGELIRSLLAAERRALLDVRVPEPA